MIGYDAHIQWPPVGFGFLYYGVANDHAKDYVHDYDHDHDGLAVIFYD